jgi:signal transduction histidine kinase
MYSDMKLMSRDHEAAVYLDSLSTLARRGFASNHEATDAILQLLMEQLTMRSSFLTHVTGEAGQFEVIVAQNEAGGCAIQVGTIVPVYQNFQSITGKSDEPAPVLLENLRSYRDISAHFVSGALSSIGSYIGAPIVLSDGTFFGTLCAVDPEPRQLSLVQARLLVVLARLLATQIERDQELAERKWAESELARAITALQTADEQRNRMDKMQSDFVSIVNHEFRTTLTGIQGFSELMRDEEFGFQEIKEYASDINADARRLSRMINKLLDLDQLRSGHISLQREQIDLNAIVMDVVDRVRSTTTRHRLRHQLDNSLPLLSGDPTRLTQVVTNLVENAVKYSSGGEILLVSKLEGEVVHVRVHDQGAGIPLEALERVFDPYYCRIESDTSRYVKGTGLGLPIVRQIVQMHAGKAWVESNLGEGSVFHFTIPSTAPTTTE